MDVGFRFISTTLSLAVASCAHVGLALLASGSVLERRRGRPVAALSWVVGVWAFPLLGALAWWAVGRDSIRRRLRRPGQRSESLASSFALPTDHPHRHLVPSAKTGSYVHLTFARETQLLPEGELAFQTMRDAMEQAQDSIHLFFFTFDLDESGRQVCDLLEERAREGVRVRLLVDGLGSASYYSRLEERFEDTAVELRCFLSERWRPLKSPRWNFANHRKIVVCDEGVGFFGGMNVGVEYEKKWEDVMVRVEGPICSHLLDAFFEDWFFATGETFVPQAHVDVQDGDSACSLVLSGPDTECWIEDTYVGALLRAERRILLTTPYFIPSSPLLSALRIAANRGVEVDLIVPQDSDVPIATLAARSFYPELLAAGVRVWEFQPAMLHAKTVVFDDSCIVGSANLDRRSLHLNFEICGVFDSPALCSELVAWATSLKAQSRLVQQEDLSRRSRSQVLLESAAHLLSPLL